ncbi:MAG: hypothetical protein IPM55_16100 [Acidobacteria bacterium]|nr:hypothetical protein [Acidobacteriota bacterium]
MPKDNPENIDKKKKSSATGKRRQGENLWETDFLELANFHISFGYEVTKSGDKQLQTRVIHYEGERNDVWNEIVRDELVDWILDQAKSAIPAEAMPKPEDRQLPTPIQTMTPPEMLEITDLEISESRAAAIGTTRPAAQMIEARCSMVVNGTATEALEKRMPFIIEFFLVDTSNNHSMLVASHTGQLNPEVDEYPVRMRFNAPSMGRYQMFINARTLPPVAANSLLTGPVIRVEL